MDTQMVSKLHRKVFSPLIDGEAPEHLESGLFILNLGRMSFD